MTDAQNWRLIEGRKEASGVRRIMAGERCIADIFATYADDKADVIRLVSAAPELLSALKNMLAITERPCSKPIGAPGSVARIEQEYRDRLYNEAIAVIAKAEGH